MIHPLRRWLFENEVQASKFAAKIGASQGYLSEIMAYQKTPSLKFMLAIKSATKGAVTPNDFERPPARRKQRKGSAAHA